MPITTTGKGLCRFYVLIKECNQLIKLGQTFQMVLLVRRCAIRATARRPADSASNECNYVFRVSSIESEKRSIESSLKTGV
jgi:hypothetical protein